MDGSFHLCFYLDFVSLFFSFVCLGRVGKSKEKVKTKRKVVKFGESLQSTNCPQSVEFRIVEPKKNQTKNFTLQREIFKKKNFVCHLFVTIQLIRIVERLVRFV